MDAILDTLAGSDKPYVYTSGVWSQGDTGGAVVDEDSPVHPIPLVAWRQVVEDRVRAGANAASAPSSSGRQSSTDAAGGIPAGFVESALKEGAARFVGTGENRWAFVHVDDLADLYLLALERAPAGTVLLAADGPSHPVRDVGRGGEPRGGEDGRTVATPLDQARRELGKYADALALDQQVSGRRARELLGPAAAPPRRARGSRTRLLRPQAGVSDSEVAGHALASPAPCTAFR